jgi:hypothetical protein
MPSAELHEDGMVGQRYLEMEALRAQRKQPFTAVAQPAWIMCSEPTIERTPVDGFSCFQNLAHTTGI